MTETRTSFQKVIDELLHGNEDLPRNFLQVFSDIHPSSLEMLLEVWPRVPADRKRRLLDGLQSLADSDTLVSFDDLARAVVTDDDAGVQARAIRLLSECDDVKLVPAFLKTMTEESSSEARIEAALALGKYVRLGELEDIPEQILHQVENALLHEANDEDSPPDVRRSALEALGFSSRLEVRVLIESAFRREDPDWQASALFAMGRSFDDIWEEQVLSKMTAVNPRVRLAAVEAVGELGLKSARTALLKVLEDEDDDDIAAAAIWSLSQLGGEDARILIENLIDQAEDDAQVEFLEDALDNLTFTDGLNDFDLMTYDPEQE